MELNNLDKLADQIYQEGIEKAQKESERIISDATSRADEIIQKARSEAESIKKNAEKEAEKEKLSAKNEIKLVGTQAISALKSNIKDLLSKKLTETTVSDSLDDVKFIKKLLLEIIGKWSPDDNLTVEVPEELQSEIQKYLQTKSEKILDGLTIRPNSEVKSGFIIENGDKGYYMSFTDEDLRSFLKEYFSSKLDKLIFE